VTKPQWSAIEALVKPVFDSGAQPERQDLVDIAFAADADDDIVDALDSLGGRPIPSLEALREQLAANGAIA
jgi:hypothetical protein